MPGPGTRRGLVALPVVIMASLGLFSPIDAAPALQQQDHLVSAVPRSDHSAVMAPQRRILLSAVTGPVDNPLVIVTGEVTAAAALLALAIGLTAARASQYARRVERFLSFALRSPPRRNRLVPLPAS